MSHPLSNLLAATMVDLTAPGSVVYFARNPDTGAVKIGRTSNISARMSQLRTALPQIQLIGYLPGGSGAEADLHVTFSNQRIAGEWFRPTEALTYTIASLLASPGAVVNR